MILFRIYNKIKMQNPEQHVIRVLKNEEKQHRKMNEEGREGTEWNLREGKNRITEWRERECVRLGFF